MNTSTIAITAMGCRYPGGVTSPGDLWRLVRHATDATGTFPPGRVDEDVSYRGGFLEDAAEFSPAAFGMSPREAELTDPQQRIALQVAAETLRGVGLERKDLHGTSTGVFIGAMAQEYGGPQYRPDGSGHGYGLTGSSPSVISGRIAYHYGLSGPAITVDTACSASLVAIHQAVRAVQNGSCEQALAGGVTVLPTPALFADFAHQGGIAADGRCKAFSSAADGVAWAEGCGLLLLETVDHARAHGRPILATISGIAINQDGASNGLSAPNGRAQESVVRAALQDAGLEPGDVDLVEAHGTGTPLGDAIEVKALARTYGRAHRDHEPAFLGSLKSNIGHAQAAAGVGGVIKAIEAMRHGQMPPTLHVEHPTTQVDWQDSGLRLLAEGRTWPRSARRPRRAAVSSFGISGTNAHVVLTEGAALPQPDPDESGVLIAHVSGGSEAALRTHAAQVLNAVERSEPAALPALLAGTRAHAPGRHGVAVIADDVADLSRGLEAVRDGRHASNPTRYVSPSLVTMVPAATDPVFVFPGQGAQWAGMVSGLYATSPSFRRHFDACASALDRHGGPQWRTALNDPEVQRPDWVQPALFATTVSLARTWMDLGVTPRAVVGSSQGEIAAAHVAGALDLDDAARTVCRRSALIHELAAPGGMVSIRASRQDVDALLAPYGGRVEVAVENAPNQTVVAGDPACLAALLDREDVDGRRIAVDYASHTAAMDILEEDLTAALGGLSCREPLIPMVSTVTGEPAGGRIAFDARYWFVNLRRTVRFRQAIDRLVEDGARVFLEVSPHPVMGQAITDVCDHLEADVRVVGSLMRDSGGPGQLAVTAAALGVSTTAEAVLPEAPPPVAETRSLWVKPAPVTSSADEAVLELPDGLRVARVDVGYDWVDEHRVATQGIAPGTLVVSALADVLDADAEITDLTLQAPLTRGVDAATVVIQPHGDAHQVTVSVPAPEGAANRTGTDRWLTVATATVRPHAPSGPAAGVSSPVASPLDSTSTSASPPAGFYEALAARGYGYGPAFRGVRSIAVTPTSAEGEVAGPPDLPWAATSPHPIQLDTVLHVALPLLGSGLWVPYRWRRVTVGHPGTGTLRVRADLVGPETVRLRAQDATGRVVFAVEELHFAAVAASQEAADLSRVVWDEVAVDHGDRAPGFPQRKHVDAIGDLPMTSCAVVDTTSSAQGPIDLTCRALGLIQQALDQERDLILLTRQALSVDVFDRIRSLSASPLVGLVRTAAAEHPGRIRLIDTDDDPRSQDALVDALSVREGAVLAVRRGRVLRSRLAGADPEVLDLPGRDWRLDRGESSTIEDIAPATNDAAARPLEPAQVRVDVRATGLNFRDVTVALGMLDSEVSMGCEVAGVVTEVGAGVQDLSVGDAVFGLAADSFAPIVVTDAAGLRPLPSGWSWSDGAASVITGVTALRALEIAGVGRGDKVLVHAATGGVGQVLLTLATALGAEVFATAHPDKHHLLRRRGLDDAHVSTSRSADFERHFDVEMDAVVNCLTGPLIDASLRLLRPGGVFVEIGKTDLRDPADVRAHYGVNYVAYNVLGETPQAVGAALDRVVPSLEGAGLEKHAVDVRYVRQAVSRLRHALHPGKLTLTVPRETNDLGVCLITGGLTGLGALSAEHLVRTARATRVVLVSRRGQDTPGAAALVERLERLGGNVEIRTCDLTRRQDVTRLVEEVRPDSVIHAAGTLHDVPIHAMNAETLSAVLAPKVTGAANLDLATRSLELRAFVLFSSAVGVLGSPGQANYAAANTFLESLAAERRGAGLVATCINWGLWAEPTGMTGRLSVAEIDVLARRTGLVALTTETGLRMLDRAIEGPATSAVAARILEPEGGAVDDERPASSRQDSAGHDGIALLTALAADVLGYADTDQIDPGAAYRDLGFDSLLTIDLRNRIKDHTGRVLKVDQILAAGTLEALASVIEGAAEDSAAAPAGV